MIKLYIDMDGVITAFGEAVKDIGGEAGLGDDASEEDKLAMYKKINEAGEAFWSKMKWAEEGKKIWKFFSKYKPILLSSPGDFFGAASGKEMWVKNNIPGTLLYLEQDKFLYAERDAILIDDMAKNIEAWEEAGGLGILYKNFEDTKDKFNELVDKNVLSSVSHIAVKLAKIILARDLNEDIKIFEDIKSYLDTCRDSDFVPSKPHTDSLTFTEQGEKEIKEALSSHIEIINSGKASRDNLNLLYMIGQFLTTIALKIEMMIYRIEDPELKRAYKDLCDIWCRGDDLNSKEKKLNAGSLMARFKGRPTRDAINKIKDFISRSKKPLKDMIEIGLKKFHGQISDSY